MLIQRQCQRGLTLIEAMIALLVVSIGLLGIASLQITAMNQNASSLHHSQAVWYAYNMSDRIRSNITQFANYNGINTDDNDYSMDCMASRCSAADMITADAADWETMISNLPGGVGVISNPGNELLVTVMWDDDGTGAGGTACGGDPNVDLTCYTLAVAQ
jgi:type IV pilus assembly protein PilV